MTVLVSGEESKSVQNSLMCMNVCVCPRGTEMLTNNLSSKLRSPLNKPTETR